MRLIDADALKETIGECPENWTDSPEEIVAFNTWHRIMDDIDSTPIIDDWISVEDRLPEDEQDYIICILAYDGTKHVTTGTYNRWYNRWIDKIGIIWVPDRVTHWRPFPEPPEEVDNDE